MSTPPDPFLRLVRLAHPVSARPPEEFPPRLAARVLAQLRAAPNGQSVSHSLWEQLALRTLPFAAVATALCLLVSYSTRDPQRADAEILVQHLLNFEPSI